MATRVRATPRVSGMPRAGLSALQAVLATLSGGIEGHTMQRAREEEQARYDAQQERQRQMDDRARDREAQANARQETMDKLTLVQQGAVPRATRTALTNAAMPEIGNTMQNMFASLAGAPPPAPMDLTRTQEAAGMFTPPIFSADVGGETYDITETPAQRAMRRAAQERGERQQDTRLAAEAKANAEAAAQQRDVSALLSAFPGKLNPAQAQAIARRQAKLDDFGIGVRPSRAGEMTDAQAYDREQELRDREAQGMVYLDQHRQDANTLRGLQTLFASNPQYRQRPGLAGYALMQQGMTAGKAAANTALVGQREASAAASQARTQGGGAKPYARYLTTPNGQIPTNTGASTTGAGAPGVKSLEQEFPAKAAQIRQARAAGYSDDEIRAYLGGGR